MNELVGQPIDRVDGRLKVTGTATYSHEYYPDKVTYGVCVMSTIAKGRMKNLDTSVAERAPGIINILTYKNSMNLHFPSGGDPGAGKYGEKDLLPLQSDRIFYGGQVIAVVIGETFEQAEHAASLVKVAYEKDQAVISLEKNLLLAYTPAQALGGGSPNMKRGDAGAAMQSSSVKIEQTYTTPVYHHNAMEPHATTAEWKGDSLMVYDSTQSVMGSKGLLSSVLGVPAEKVHLIALYIGGGFGSKGFSWPNLFLAPMAAKLVNRPVKLALSRQQVFTTAGRRTQTIQKISLGADNNGKLNAVKHESISETSFVDEFVETSGLATSMLYSSANTEVSHQIVRLNRGTPCPMRAPGEAPGTVAIESAMDELAYKLNMDPVQLRLLNYADTEEQKKLPFSSKNLKECYQKGADAIGWQNRNPQPGMVKEGNYLIGYGMATATYPANRSASTAKATLFPDGHAEILCGTQDIGTGTYTIMTQLAADSLGLPIDKVKVKLGDSNYPKGANSGGSQVTASVGPAIRAAALGAKSKMIKLAIADEASPLHGQTENAILVDNGRLFINGQPDKGETYTQILNRHSLDKMEALANTNVSTRPAQGGGEKHAAVQEDEKVDRKNYAFHSFGAQFVKVRVDAQLGTVHVDKIVSVMDIGKVMNLKTAKNQIMGGIIFAIGMALMEETQYDPNDGRVITHDLAQYLVPVHADMPEFDIQFIDKPDPYISPIGARGIGEIGITGTTAAIANAIYNATGKRVRDMPVTPDKLLSV